MATFGYGNDGEISVRSDIYDEDEDHDLTSRLAFLTIHPGISNLKAKASGQTTVELSWKLPDERGAGINVDQALGDGAFSNIASLAASVTAHAVTGLTAGTRYRFRVVTT